MIDLQLQQKWLKHSSDTAFEEFKSALVDMLNRDPVDRHTTDRWSITKISEGDISYLIYDEKPLATLRITGDGLRLHAEAHDVPRSDDLMFAVRATAQQLELAVISNAHGNARLPNDPALALDHSFFERNAAFASFFKGSPFIPRYCAEHFRKRGDTAAITVEAPFFAEDKDGGAIHILNDAMLSYLVTKEDQTPSHEFSYKVADNMQDFAKKYDFGLVPRTFYQNCGRSAKIINNTDFAIDHITRKVFIDPYVWDFDAEHERRYYQNANNGLHLMDKVRKGETLDAAIKRILRDELQLGAEYVGARIWGIDFDRDREGQLTPRLRMYIFVHGLLDKQGRKDHDWVSIK